MSTNFKKTDSDLANVRFLTGDDPYHYTVDNRPLTDLDENIRKVAKSVDAARMAGLIEAIGNSAINTALIGRQKSIAGLGVITSSNETVLIDRGAILFYEALSNDYPQEVLKRGVLFSPTTVSTPSAIISGKEISYLIQVQYADLGYADTLPLEGMDNPYLSSSIITGKLVISVLSSGISDVGTSVVPSVSAGWTPLYAVIAEYGRTLRISDAVGKPGNIRDVWGYQGVVSPFFEEVLTSETQEEAKSKLGLMDTAGTDLGVTVSTVDATLSSSTGASAVIPSATQTSAGLLSASDKTYLDSAAKVLISNKSAPYTVVAGDLNKIINCTSGSFTVYLTAAATLGAGFNCWVWNSSASYSDTITIDPNASETIDGVATLRLGRGEGVQVICDGVSWQTGSKKAIRGYVENFSPATSRPSATVHLAVAIGAGAAASNTAAIAMGFASSAAAAYSAAIGNNSAGTGSQVATGDGAMALGGSYASGADSFAAAIGNNTSSYGALGASSIAIGDRALASGGNSVAVGGRLNIASGTYSTALGGFGNTASGIYSQASGAYAVADKYGKKAFASGKFSVAGDAQAGKMVLRRKTTDATPTVLTSDGVAGSSTNQVILPDYSTFTFRIQVVAMQKVGDGSKTAGYEFTGVIRRGPGAASTVIKSSTKNVLYEDDAAWDCNVSADGVSGGMSIAVTGAASTNIAWAATVWTTEVTYL